jgi:hypothetical protein
MTHRNILDAPWRKSTKKLGPYRGQRALHATIDAHSR